VPPEEDEAFLRVLCQGFDLEIGTARLLFLNDPYYPYNQRWGLWVQERKRPVLVSIATAIPLQFWMRGRVVDSYGIAGVTTLHEYRRRGLAHQLLRAIVRTMYNEAVPGLTLQAFDHEFYRKLDWETVGTLTRLRLSPSHLPAFLTQGVRTMQEGDPEAVFRLCETTLPLETGRLVRDELRWNYMLWNYRNKWVYEHQGHIEGYLLYDFLEEGWVLRVRELVWSTERARRALIGWLASNRERVRQIEFAGTLADLQPILQHLTPALGTAPERPIASLERVPGLMWRTTHPEAMLRALLEGLPAPEPFLPLILVISDPLFPESPWRLELTAPDGLIQVSAQQGDTRAHQVWLSSRAFSLLVWGSEEPHALWTRKLLRAEESALPVLEALFPPQEVCLRLSDYF